MSKICPICKTEKDESEFASRSSRCRVCKANEMRELRAAKRGPVVVGPRRTLPPVDGIRELHCSNCWQTRVMNENVVVCKKGHQPTNAATVYLTVKELTREYVPRCFRPAAKCEDFDWMGAVGEYLLGAAQ